MSLEAAKSNADIASDFIVQITKRLEQEKWTSTTGARQFQNANVIAQLAIAQALISIAESLSNKPAEHPPEE